MSAATVGIHTRPRGGLVRIGAVAAVVATAVTTLGAALARAAGVDLAVSGGETIPVAGVAVVTGFFAAVGVVLAGALARWSGRPADRFVGTAWALTGVSMVPPVLVGASVATALTLMGLHLVAALVMIPALGRTLRGQHPTARG